MTGLRKSLLSSNGVPPAASQGSSESPQAAAPSAPPAAVPGSPAAAGELPPAVSLSDADLARSFRPTEAQVRAKAKYLSAVLQNPLEGASLEPLARAKKLTRSAALAGWWQRPGFKDWFLSGDTVGEQLQWLEHLALEAIQDLLLNTDPKAQGARLSAAKLVAEMTGRLSKAPQASAEDKKRKAIDSMSREQLTELLESQGIRIEQVAVVDAAAPKQE